jgi:hypothetical protein
MMRTDNSDNSSSSSSNGFFSPDYGRRASLHDLLTPTPPSSTIKGDREEATKTPPLSQDDTLPRLQDNSWIGAKVSPIPSQADEDDNDEEDEEDMMIMAPYHTALKEASFLGVATEETTLLGRKMVSNKRSTGGRMLGYHQNHTTTTTTTQSATAAVSTTNAASMFVPGGGGNNGPILRSGGGSGGYPIPLEDGTPLGGMGAANPLHHGAAYGRLHYPPQPSASVWQRMWNCPFWFVQQRFFYLIIPFSTALFLFCVGIHDAFLAYLSIRRGIEPSYSLSWNIPWLGPSERSMLRFGAFCPQRIFQDTYGEVNYTQEQPQTQVPFYAWEREYWRLLTSAVWVTSSLVEWLLVLLAWWWAISRSRIVETDRTSGIVRDFYSPTSFYFGQQTNNHFSYSSSEKQSAVEGCMAAWPVVYMLSTLTGQLWMVSFEYPSSASFDGDDGPNISGCTSWGTAGVLCAMGMRWPERRFELFILAIALVIINLLQPTSSVFGAIGASFFGWSFAGMWVAKTPASSINNAPVKSSWHHYYEVDDGNYKEAAHKPSHDKVCGFWSVFSALVMISLWLLPILYIKFYW